MLHPKRQEIVRQVNGYFQDTAGQWWLLNKQTGWVRVPLTSRALQRAIADYERNILGSSAKG